MLLTAHFTKSGRLARRTQEPCSATACGGDALIVKFSVMQGTPRDDSRRKEGSLSRRSGKTGIGCRCVPEARPVRPLRSRLPDSSGRGTCGDLGVHRDSLTGWGPGHITRHSWLGALSHLWAREEACRQGICWGWPVGVSRMESRVTCGPHRRRGLCVPPGMFPKARERLFSHIPT